MRIVTFFVLLMAFACVQPAHAAKKHNANSGTTPSGASLFEVDEAVLETEFAELTQLENLALSQSMTYSELLTTPTLAGVDIPRLNGMEYSGDWRDPILNMNPFWFTSTATCLSWLLGLGCVAGPVAVIYVYVDTGNDKSAAVSSGLGCVLGNLPAAIGYILYIALVVSVNSA
ncbi:MAG: hypothetical protein ACFB10_17705 [Salibacteraceae bacterium]